MTSNLDVPIRYTPMCQKHFMDFAKDYYNISPATVLDHLYAPEPSPQKVTKTIKVASPKAPTAPTRTQPRRAAKDKVLQAKAMLSNSKKRAAEDDTDTQGPSKKRKISKPGAPPSMTLELLGEIFHDAFQDVFTNVKECPYGPRPWICADCEKLDAVRREEFGSVGWSYHKGKAPVADMQPSGEELWLAGWEKLELAQRRVHRFGDLQFVVDTCDEPKVLIISRITLF